MPLQSAKQSTDAAREIQCPQAPACLHGCARVHCSEWLSAVAAYRTTVRQDVHVGSPSSCVSVSASWRETCPDMYVGLTVVEPRQLCRAKIKNKYNFSDAVIRYSSVI